MKGTEERLQAHYRFLFVRLSARRMGAMAVLVAISTFGYTKVAAAPPPTDQDATMESPALHMDEIDPRYKSLENFFQQYKCPAPHYVNEYIEDADKYQVPYNLLPAIALKESGCGKQVPGLMIQGTWIEGACNNEWGWLIYGHNRKCFDSVPDGINEVLKNFGTNPKWEGTVQQILYKYNGIVDPKYPSSVMNIMNQI